MVLPLQAISLLCLMSGIHALMDCARTFHQSCRRGSSLFAESSLNKPISNEQSRRRFVHSISFSTIGPVIFALPFPAHAAGAKSRTDGYAVQRTKDEWTSMLTPMQFDVLRKGGTESPYSSILEAEERPGVYSCAGCGTELFIASEKFHSGTGWPSFATGLGGVKVEKVNSLQANLAGAEIRCATCGGKPFYSRKSANRKSLTSFHVHHTGHLGDVFNDGWIFPGTPAFISGKRLCVDGAALVFRPEVGDEVVGDKPPPAGSPRRAI